MKKKLKGLNVLITAGPTQEPIDPVRYIGNRSSGKMGYAIAEEFANRGANVTLISGPVNLILEHPMVRIIAVSTAEQMYIAAREEFPKNKISVFAAAVADFSPENPYKDKLKKGEQNLILKLRPTKDIAATLGMLKTKEQILVGFALETCNEVENASNKLRNKNLDIIVLNSLRDEGAGFQTDTNKISIIDKYNNIDNFELKPKTEVARDIIEKIINLL